MYPQNDWRSYLMHSARGQKWSNHKYLYITPNGTYVYQKQKRSSRTPGIIDANTVSYVGNPGSYSPDAVPVNMSTTGRRPLGHKRKLINKGKIVKIKKSKLYPTIDTTVYDSGLKIRNSNSNHRRKGQTTSIQKALHAKLGYQYRKGYEDYDNWYNANGYNSRRRRKN